MVPNSDFTRLAGMRTTSCKITAHYHTILCLPTRKMFKYNLVVHVTGFNSIAIFFQEFIAKRVQRKVFAIKHMNFIEF